MPSYDKKLIAFVGTPLLLKKYRTANTHGPISLYRGLKKFGSEYNIDVRIVAERTSCNPACLYDASDLSASKDPEEFAEVKASLASGTLFTIEDMYWLKKADAYCVHTAFGATAPDRVFSPDMPNNFNTKTIVKEMLNTTAEDMAKFYNKKLIVLETGTLSRLRANTCNVAGVNYLGHNPKYERIGLDSWVYNKATWCKPRGFERVDALIAQCDKTQHYKPITNIYNHKWKNDENGFIVIIGGLEGDPSHSHLSIEDFIIDSYTKIREVSKRKIVFRPHPFSELKLTDLLLKLGIEIFRGSPTLVQAAPKMYCAVIDNSTSVFELINLGIPCMCTPSSFAYPLRNSNLSMIEELYYASPDEVLEWYKEMSYTEFTTAEMSSKVICEYIRELID